jgi:hypothetical protein
MVAELLLELLHQFCLLIGHHLLVETVLVENGNLLRARKKEGNVVDDTEEMREAFGGLVGELLF